MGAVSLCKGHKHPREGRARGDISHTLSTAAHRPKEAFAIIPQSLAPGSPRHSHGAQALVKRGTFTQDFTIQCYTVLFKNCELCRLQPQHLEAEAGEFQVDTSLGCTGNLRPGLAA